MGTEQSRLSSDPLKEWDCNDVAEHVSSFGKSFVRYADVLLRNGVDGIFLVSLSCSDDIQDVLDNLNIESRLHRRVLETKLTLMFATDAERKKRRVPPMISLNDPVVAVDEDECSCCHDDGTAKTEGESEEFLDEIHGGGGEGEGTEHVLPGGDSSGSNEKSCVLELMIATKEQQQMEHEFLLRKLQELHA